MFDPTVPLNEDVDVAALHDDYSGVPWSFFIANASGLPTRLLPDGGIELDAAAVAAGAEALLRALRAGGGPAAPALPTSWLLRLNTTLAATRAWGLPAFGTLQMLTSPMRTCPAQNASDGPNGEALVTPFEGCTSCYDFSPATNPRAMSLVRAYALYAAFMAGALQGPTSLAAFNFAAEINLGARICPPAWFDGVTAMSNAVYGAVRAYLDGRGASATPIFPSIQLEVVLGVQTGPDMACAGLITNAPAPPVALQACVQDGLALVAGLKRDAFGVSTYPSTVANSEGGPRWPAWYLPVVLSALAPTDRASFLVAETGFDSESIVVNVANDSQPVECFAAFNATVGDANAWLAYLVGQATSGGWGLVTWWSDADFLWSGAMTSCPCATPPAYEHSCGFVNAYRQVLAAAGQPAYVGELDAKVFGTMGLRGLDRTKKPLWDTMQAARAASGG